MKKLFFALALFTLPLVSCNRYEEGSNFSLLTAKARVVGEWLVTDISTNGQDVTSNFPNVSVSIKNDNTYTITFSLFGFQTSENGTWTFNDDKTRFLMTSNTGNLSDRKIIMLKNKMLKLEEVNALNNDVTVWTLEQ